MPSIDGELAGTELPENKSSFHATGIEMLVIVNRDIGKNGDAFKEYLHLKSVSRDEHSDWRI